MQGVIGRILLIAALPTGYVGAVTNYVTIPERNAFGLKSPPEREVEPAPEQQSSFKVRLTGITTILGAKQALLVISPTDAKSGEDPESLILKEGERHGPVEVIRINEREGTVLVINSGRQVSLKFEEVPPPASATPGANSPQNSVQIVARTNSAANVTGLPPNNPAAAALAARMSALQSRRGSQYRAEYATNASPETPTPLPTTTSQAQIITSPQLTADERAALLQIEEQVRQSQAQQQGQSSPPPAGYETQRVYEQPIRPVPYPLQPPYPVPQ